MASNFTDEERTERIIMVGEYFINNPNVSTRKISEYFSNMENGFKISNVTVLDYIKRYKEMLDSIGAQFVVEKLSINKPKTVDDKCVRDRVLSVVSYFLDGMTVQDIVCKTGYSFWVIYRDLTERLEKIDYDLYLKVSSEMNRRRFENLRKCK